MNVFAEAIDDLFADPNLVVPALWRAGGSGPGVPIRVMLRQADRVTDFGDTRIASGSTVIEVRTSEVPAPAEGDTVEVAGQILVVQGEPLGGTDRLVWTLDCRPA